MIEFFREHKLLIISAVLIFGFFALALGQEPEATGSETQSSYKNVDTSSPMFRGNKDAKVSIIQYSDFLCPYCSLFSTQVMPTIDKTYIETGKANFEFRPMAFIAKDSVQAGAGGFCAIDQNKFWPYHDAVYTYVADKIFNEGKNPQIEPILTNGAIKSIASSAGLEAEPFGSCLDSGKHNPKVIESTQLANSNGINGTPYIMVNGQHYRGGITLTSFEALVKANLQ